MYSPHSQKKISLFAGLSSEVLSKVIALEDEEDQKMFKDLGIPDEMLRCFDSKHPIKDFLSSSLVGMQTFTYPRRSQTWLATVYDYYHNSRRQLTIKLSHDGFVYHRRAYTDAKIFTHGRPDWFLLGEDVLKDMPFLTNLKSSLNARILFYYNIVHKRIDIHFRKEDEEAPFMLITFETGFPESVVSKDKWI